MDNVNKFINEFYVISKEPRDKIERAVLNKIYEKYCIDNSLKYNEGTFKNYLIMKLGEATKDSKDITIIMEYKQK